MLGLVESEAADMNVLIFLVTFILFISVIIQKEAFL